MTRVYLRAAAAALLGLAAAAPASALSINLNITGGGSRQAQAFQDAADFWSGVLGNYTANGAGGTLSIDVVIGAIDGVGGILGSAGPTSGLFFSSLQRLYSTAGQMTFDIADINRLQEDRELLAVATHEIGHVIGFGTLWGFQFNGVTYNDVYNESALPGQYYGPAALAAYQAAYDAGATYVPVELDGGDGTAHGHWDETWAGGVFELMTGFLNSPVNVSYVTLAQFQDLGYVIATEEQFAEALETLNINMLRVDVPGPAAAPLALSALLALGLVGRRRRGA